MMFAIQEMHDESIRLLAKRMRSDGKTYKEIGYILGISLFSARKLCTYERGVPKKRGQHGKVDKVKRLAIKRKIEMLKKSGQRIVSSRLIKDLNLKLSLSTVHRYLIRSGYKYKKARSQIILSEHHKEERRNIIGDWISDNHDWSKTVFSDEKRFTLDGPDDWQTYVMKTEAIVRNKRQCKGGGIMLWLMCMPNGLLAFRILNGTFNSDNYIKLLSEMAVPILKINYGTNFYYQEDNSPVHKSQKVRKYMTDSGIKVIKWPSRSPDLNIVENIWQMISSRVYNGPQFDNKQQLTKKVIAAINDINTESRDSIRNLYTTFRRRLVVVLHRHGDLFNK